MKYTISKSMAGYTVRKNGSLVAWCEFKKEAIKIKNKLDKNKK